MRALLLALLFGLLPYAAAAIKPDRVYAMQPAALGLPFDTAVIRAADGVPLSVWAIRPPKSVASARTTILLAYGDSGNKSHWLTQASMLANNGFTVVLFDYRGFGGSGGTAGPAELLYEPAYTADLRAALDWARRVAAAPKMVVYAFSMGTIVAATAGVLPNVDAYVFEGLVSRPDSTVARIGRLKNKKVLLPPAAAQVPRQFQQISKPVLVFAGKTDPVTTPDDARVFAGGAKNRQLVPFDGGHGGGFSSLGGAYPGERYIRHIKTFLGQR